jgi:hypothetical protein
MSSNVSDLGGNFPSTQNEVLSLGWSNEARDTTKCDSKNTCSQVPLFHPQVHPTQLFQEHLQQQQQQQRPYHQQQPQQSQQQPGQYFPDSFQVPSPLSHEEASTPEPLSQDPVVIVEGMMRHMTPYTNSTGTPTGKESLRKEKNRETSRRSRQKKKCYILDLEERLQRMESILILSHQHVQSLIAEGEKVKVEIKGLNEQLTTAKLAKEKRLEVANKPT